MALHLADSERDKHVKGEGSDQVGYSSSGKVVEILREKIKTRREKAVVAMVALLFASRPGCCPNELAHE